MRNLNVKPEIAVAFSFGLTAGSWASALYGRHLMKQQTDLSVRQLRRWSNKVDYMIDKMGPHVPKEVLDDVLVYMQADIMEAEEDRIRLGIPPKDESTD